MQVVTFSQKDLDAAAARLAEEVAASGRGPFDAIVGIRRGGSFVCDSFCAAFPEALYGCRHDITIQRPGTKRKGGLAGRLLRHLPTRALDLMRMAESVALAALGRLRKGIPPAANLDMDRGLDSIVRNTSSPRLLLIDDAIDSGNTLCAAISSLKKINPAASITVAVITETTRAPRVRADFTLYRNRTLIRFPWSNDFKKTPKGQHS